MLSLSLSFKTHMPHLFKQYNSIWNEFFTFEWYFTNGIILSVPCYIQLHVWILVDAPVLIQVHFGVYKWKSFQAFVHLKKCTFRLWCSINDGVYIFHFRYWIQWWGVYIWLSLLNSPKWFLGNASILFEILAVYKIWISLQMFLINTPQKWSRR